ncbi:MAG: WecB/TagA/CpsF family glycosyltransferase [Pseudomonadota bacterium]
MAQQAEKIISGASAPAASSSAARRIARSPLDRDAWCVFGAPIDLATIDAAIAEIDDAVTARRRLSFVTPNVNWLVRAAASEAARREIRDADLSLADGAPVALMARLLGAPLAGRVAGADLFETLRRRPGFAGQRAIRVYFFGGRDGAAEAAAEALGQAGSALTSAGWMNPGFGDLESMSAPAVIDAINAAKPDFVVVALGAAKGQAWIDRNQDRLEAPVIAHLGAVVDFTGGAIRRAPKLLQRMHLEWAWRIKEEPALWRRYARDGAMLSRLLITRLAPSLFALSTQKSSGDARAARDASRHGAALRLAGDHRHGGLGAARAAFKDALEEDGDIVLDCEGLGRVDMAFVGLLVLFERELARRGRRLLVAKISKTHHRLLALNDVDFADAPERSDDAETTGRSHAA